VFLLDKKAAASTTLMQLPPIPSKQTLGLTQRYLVMQLRPLANKPLTVEINVLSRKDGGQRYRLHLSTKFRTIEMHQMHAQIPLGPLLTPDTWVHFIVDVAHLTSYFFRNKDFGSIDSISLHSGCRLRVRTSHSMYLIGDFFNVTQDFPAVTHCPSSLQSTTSFTLVLTYLCLSIRVILVVI
jgi:hypothetical protein